MPVLAGRATDWGSVFAFALRVVGCSVLGDSAGRCFHHVPRMAHRTWTARPTHCWSHALRFDRAYPCHAAFRRSMLRAWMRPSSTTSASRRILSQRLDTPRQALPGKLVPEAVRTACRQPPRRLVRMSTAVCGDRLPSIWRGSARTNVTATRAPESRRLGVRCETLAACRSPRLPGSSLPHRSRHPPQPRQSQENE